MSDQRATSPLVRALLTELAADPAGRDLLADVLGDPPSAQRLLSADEAAARLGVHAVTLRKAAREGRVVGAQRHSSRMWRFRPDVLKLLPPAPRHLASVPGQPSRVPGESSAVSAIRGGRAA